MSSPAQSIVPAPQTGSRRNRSRLSLLTTLALGLLGLAAPHAALAEATSEAGAPRSEASTPQLPVAEAPAEAPAARSEESLAVRGIYLQQLTLRDAARLQDLIEKAKRAGFNTFVVDLWGPSPDYDKAIKTIQDAGLHYVPRITMFPDGARPEQIADQQLLERRWRLVDHALKLGAKDIQLDYIRFSSKNPASPENSSKVLEVLRFFRQRIQQRGARMQIDVFGEVSYGPSIRIGQDMRVFAPDLDAVCPMLYPSHFEPHEQTAKTPYETVHGAILALERQTKANPLPIYPWIEHFNYRHRMTEEERAAYFEKQLEAVLNSGSRGFYIWSVGNYYDIPFSVLERRARARRQAEPLPGTPSVAIAPIATPPGQAGQESTL